MNLMVLALVLGLIGAGCEKSGGDKSTGADRTATPSAKPVPAAETIGRIHWLGKDRLAAATNVDLFMGIWSLSESTNLEAQTLARLATAPWRLLPGAPALSNAPSALMLPLLEDLLRKEVLLEIRQTGDAPGALVLATRTESNLWSTNLAAALEHLTGIKPAADGTNGWILQKHDAPDFIELRRAGDWVVVGLSQSSNRFAVEIGEGLLETPSPAAESNYFATIDLDLPRISRAFRLGWNLPTDWPRITLTMTGDGNSVRTRGDLVFPRPLPFQVEPWNIPTNLIHDPLVSFTAVQGLASWLNAWPGYQELQLGPAPNQLFVWAQSSMPFLSYAAAAVPDGTNFIAKLSQTLIDKANPWLTNNGIGFFEKGTNGAEVLWSDLLLMSPFLQAVPGPQTNYIFGGLVGPLNTNKPMPAELLRQFENRKDLIGYNWEITGPRLQQWLYFGQLTRFALSKGQIPPASVGFAWLRALEGRADNSGTALSVSGPNRLTVTRNSTLGLNSAELIWLVDWLESPTFPKGLNTFTGKPETLNPGKHRAPKPGAPGTK